MKLAADTAKDIHNSVEKVQNATKKLAEQSSQEMELLTQAMMRITGRGFAVVADQIGKLATDSAQSAVNTNSLIAKLLQEINEGNEITVRTVAALQEVIQGIRTLAEAAQQSRELSAEQAETMGQVQQGIVQIADVVQSNSASAEETSATSEELLAQSQNLRAMVEQFTLLEKDAYSL